MMSREICMLLGMLVMLTGTDLIGYRTAPSDIWIRKMRTYFRTLDFDRDQVVSRKDFERIGERFADEENFEPVEKEKVRKSFSDIFSVYTAAAGTKCDVLMTEDLLIESLKVAKHDPSFKKIIEDLLLSLFIPMKVEKKGYFNYGEYRRVFENVGIVDTVFTKAAFTAIDTNHDGKVSVKEIIDAAYDYMSSDDKNSTALFGLLF